MRLSRAQIWGDPELVLSMPAGWWSGWVLLMEALEWQSSEQELAWDRDHLTPAPHPSTSRDHHTCRKGLAPGTQIDGAQERTPACLPGLERPGPQAGRGEAAPGHGVDSPCFFQHN